MDILQSAPVISDRCLTFQQPSTLVMSLESGIHTWAMGYCLFCIVPGCRVFSFSEAQYLDPRGRMYPDKINPRLSNINVNAMHLRDNVNPAQVGGMCCS